MMYMAVKGQRMDAGGIGCSCGGKCLERMRVARTRPVVSENDHGNQWWCLSRVKALLEQERFGPGL